MWPPVPSGKAMSLINIPAYLFSQDKFNNFAAVLTVDARIGKRKPEYVNRNWNMRIRSKNNLVHHFSDLWPTYTGVIISTWDQYAELGQS